MTKKQAKHHLKAILQDEKYLRLKKHDIMAMRRMTASLAESVKSQAGMTGRFDTFIDAMTALVKTELHHADLLARCQKRLAETEKKIRSIAQPYSNILYLRYIKGYSWVKTAAACNYSVDRAKHLLDRALEEYCNAA